MLGALRDPLAYGFFQRSLVAAVIVGLVCSVVGSFMVLRGLAFMGDAISHSAFPGVVAAYLLKGPFYLGAVIAAVGTALAIGWIGRRGNLRGDTVIGVLFAGMFSLGVFLFSTIRELRRRPVRIPVRRDPRHLPDRPARPERPGRRRPCDRGAALERAPLLDLRPPRRGGVRPACRRPRLPLPRADRDDDRGEPPGGGDHPGRRDARHAGGHGPAAHAPVRPADGDRRRHRGGQPDRWPVPELLARTPRAGRRSSSSRRPSSLSPSSSDRGPASSGRDPP